MSNKQQLAAERNGYFWFLIVFLGMLSAFGPFVTDMYLPTLPSMVEVFHTSESMVQLGLTTAMIGLAIGQIFFGPLSEKYGRKPIVVLSMVIFSIAALASVFSTSIGFFLVCRFFQGIGGSGGIVISRSISTDSYSGRELAKVMGIIGAVHGVAPVAAPVIGGLMAGTLGWRGIFVVLLVLGLILLGMCVKFVETLPKEKRMTGSILSTFGGFAQVVRVRSFVFPVLAFGGGNFFLFAYISSAPFIMQQMFGFSALSFSIFFAVNAVAIGLGASLAAKFRRLSHALIVGAVLMGVFSVGELLNSLFWHSFIIYECLVWLALFSLGFIFTSASTMAMEAGRVCIGAAAAIVGAIGFLIGGIVSPIVGMGNILVTTSIVFVGGSLFTLFFAYYVYLRNRGQNVI
ncbi:MAG: Bcr/CflA family efflux MFS transporter [Bacteroidales bacterium]|nr:Bcr/CflA family efflux MFS transporter [Bacteroidales bacterium]